MNPRWKEPWVAALRSGEYSQGHHALKGTGGYCCLGVLCHIAKDEMVIDGWGVDEGAEHMTVEAGTPSQVVLPPALMMYFGLNSEEMFILTSMNDGELNEFNVIASYIEEAL